LAVAAVAALQVTNIMMVRFNGLKTIATVTDDPDEKI